MEARTKLPVSEQVRRRNQPQHGARKACSSPMQVGECGQSTCEKVDPGGFCITSRSRKGSNTQKQHASLDEPGHLVPADMGWLAPNSGRKRKNQYPCVGVHILLRNPMI